MSGDIEQNAYVGIAGPYPWGPRAVTVKDGELLLGPDIPCRSDYEVFSEKDAEEWYPFDLGPEDYEELRLLDLPAPPPPRKVTDRPSWDDYFLGMAFLASQRSPDLSTQHGCVIVHSESHHILGTGYNGFPPGADDEALQVTREVKYANVIHSEVNAIRNCSVNPRWVPGLTAYVTGQCCSKCARHLAEHGIKNWVMADRRGFTNHDPEDLARFREVVEDHGVSIRRIKPRLDWMVSRPFLDDLRSHGFIRS